MQEEPIERMNRGLIRSKGDSVNNLSREIFDYNNKKMAEAGVGVDQKIIANLKSESFVNSSICATDKKDHDETTVIFSPKTAQSPDGGGKNITELTSRNNTALLRET